MCFFYFEFTLSISKINQNEHNEFCVVLLYDDECNIMAINNRIPYTTTKEN